MLNLLLISLGGGLGAAARFGASGVLGSKIPAKIPVATMLINVAGSLLLGLLTGLSTAVIGSQTLAILGTGFCGGFTTFSTASVELVNLAKQSRLNAAALLAIATMALGLVAGMAGMAAGSAIAN